MAVNRLTFEWYALIVIAAGLFGMLFPLPWSIILFDNIYNHRRLVQVLSLVLLAIVWASGSARQQIILLNLRVFYSWAALFFLGGGLSLLLCSNFAAGLLEYLHWGLLLSLFVVSALLGMTQKSNYLILCFLLLHGLMVWTAALYLGSALYSGGPLDPSLIYPRVAHIRFFNQMQAFAVPLLVFVGMRSRFYPAVMLLLFVNFLLMFIGVSRGLLLSLVLCLGFVFVLLPAWRRDILQVAKLFFAALGVYFLLVWLQGEGASYTAQGTNGRIAIWLDVIGHYSWSSLLWGYGPGHYTSLPLQYPLGHPHNIVLQVLTEWGGLSLLGVLGAFVIFVKRGAIFCMNKGGGEVIGCYVAVLVGALYAMFSGVLFMPVPQLLFFLLAGIAWGNINAMPSCASVSVSGQRVAVLPWLMLLVCLCVFIVLLGKYMVQQTGLVPIKEGPGYWFKKTMLEVNLTEK